MTERTTDTKQRHVYFVTGKLAASALRDEVEKLSQQFDFVFTIGVMPITVAALMTPKWLGKHWSVPPEATEVIVPGFLGDVTELQSTVKVPVRVGPKDLRLLPEFFGAKPMASIDRTCPYDIEIIAEINHAPQLKRDALISQALQLQADGANCIDLGCSPGMRWHDVAAVVRDLVQMGLRISIDSFDAWEVQQAVSAGASLVLSVQSETCAAAVDWGCEVVVIPDTPDDLNSLEATVAWLDRRGVPMRLDPILEPIGTGGPAVAGKAFGFTASLQRYIEVRRRFPDHAMMMGIGNLTELTDVDSAGVNVVLLGICQELSIGSVLTTQVINWARTAVRECDIARRLVYHAVRNGIPPKRLCDALVMLRDPKLRPFSSQTLDDLADQLKDNNYRLFAQDGRLHLVSAAVHLQDADPFALFDQLLQLPQSDNVDPNHAFYLGFELAKAMAALTLGKQYEQDQALSWGCLTVPEKLHRLQRGNRHRQPKKQN